MSTPVPMFTLADLMEALQSEQAKPEGYHTLAQWAALLDVSPSRMRVLFYMAKEAGKLRVEYERREAIDGRMAKVPVYSFNIARSEET